MFKTLALPWLVPLFGMFFAAGADALAITGNDTGAINAGDTGGDTESSTSGDGADLHTDDSTDTDGDRPQDQSTEQRDTRPQEEPEVSEFKTSVSRRLQGLVKQSPALAQAFKENPKLQEQIEATFRREAALREVFPTVAEARQMRERFPNGLQDVQALESDIAEVEQLDSDFYTRDGEGNYPGHLKILNNMFQDDRAAALALFRTLPKEWARLDRESYNDVMGRIVGVTIAEAGIAEFAQELAEAAKEAKHAGLEKGLRQLVSWAQGFSKEKAKPTAEEERFGRERAQFAKEKADRDKEEVQRFSNTFSSQSRSLQVGIIKQHPAIKRLYESKNVTDAKKAEIVEQVRKSIEGLLKNSRSFMSKLRPAYASRNLDETIKVQRAAWSQGWLLNRMVRTVLNKETPQMVSANRDSVRRRAGAPQNVRPAKNSERDTSPKGPVKIDGRWYRDGGKGAPFSTAEVLAGKHLQA